jgi:hypothetical protein
MEVWLLKVIDGGKRELDEEEEIALPPPTEYRCADYLL